jgi:hypothetical protein
LRPVGLPLSTPLSTVNGQALPYCDREIGTS